MGYNNNSPIKDIPRITDSRPCTKVSVIRRVHCIYIHCRKLQQISVHKRRVCLIIHYCSVFRSICNICCISVHFLFPINSPIFPLFCSLFFFRTNLPKEIMPFPGFPFRSDLPSYVTHSDMLDYLQHYTEHYDLHKHVQFHTVVESIRPLPISHPIPALHASGTKYGSKSCSSYHNGVRTNSENGIRATSGDGAGSSPGNELENRADIQGDNVKWSVTCENLKSGTTQENIYDAVIVCNG